MIAIQYPGLPLNGEIQWERAECVHVPERRLLGYLHLTPEQLEFVVLNGQVLTAEQVPVVVPNDGDEIHVVPKLEGKNGGVIVGVIGAVIAIYLAIPSGGASLSLWAGLQAGAGGFALGSAAWSLTHPVKSKPGDKTPTTYAFDGVTNEDTPGIADPVCMGLGRTGGVRVSSFVRLTEAPDTDTSKTKPAQRFYLLLYVSKGRIESLFDPRLNNQPINNFPGCTWAYTLGEDPEKWYDGTTNAVIPRPTGFSVTATTYSQSVDLNAVGVLTGGYIYTTHAGFNLDAVEFLVAYPDGIFHGTTTGDQPNKITLHIAYRLHGTSTWHVKSGDGLDSSGFHERTATTRSAYYERLRLDGLPPGQYDFQLEMTGAVNTDTTKDAWKPWLIGVTEEQQDAATHPNKALVAFQGVAVESLNGQIPTGSVGYKGIRVPTWDPITGFSAPTWTGPDATRPVGRNRAWLTLAIHRDRSRAAGGGLSAYEAWGYGDRIPDSSLYLPAWKAWADACAADVAVHPDDGSASYTEPAHQLDIVLNQQRPFRDTVTELMAGGRATPGFAGNGAQRAPIYDGPADPVQLFTMGNIVAGSFTKTSERNPINAYDVSFQDAALEGGTATITVADKDDELAGLPFLYQQISFFGITRQSEIQRECRFQLRKNKAQRRTISFGANIDSILMRVGNVFNFAHNRPQWGWSGRVRDNSTTTNTTTRVLTQIPARSDISGVHIPTGDSETLIDLATQTWGIRVRFQDGSAEDGQQHTIHGVAVNDGFLTATVGTAPNLPPPVSGSVWEALAQPFTTTPKAWDLVAIGPIGKEVKPFRDIGITLSSNTLARQITAIEYNASVYDDDGTLEVIDYSSLPNFGAIPPPITGTVVAYEDLSVRNDTGRYSTVILSWSRPDYAFGYGFYEEALVEVSEEATPLNYQPIGRGVADFRWPNAPHEIPLTFRVTPISTGGRQNLAGRAYSSTITCHGSQDLPANVTGLTLTRSGDAVLAAWTDISREMQYEIRTTDANWGDPAHPPLFSGRATQYRIVGPASRSITLYVKAFTPFAKYSAAATSATITIPIPSPPSVGTISKTDNWMKIAVGPSSQEGVRVIYMWASKTNGFTPGDATRVSMTVGPAGGEFTFHTTDTATWFFRVACADAISDRLNAAGAPDFSFSGQFNTALVVITPQLPTGVGFTPNGAVQHRRAVSAPTSGPPTTAKIFSLFVNWTFSDSVNAAGTLVGFQVIVYLAAGGDPNAPYWDSGILASVSQRSCGIDGLTVESSAIYLAAVRSVYIDGNNLTRSSYVTSSGLTLDPGTADDPIAQLKFDPVNGGYYSTDTTKLVDAAGNTIFIDKNGVYTVTANGLRRSPRRVIRSLLRGAINGQFVGFNDSNLDPPLYASSEFPPTSKLHVIAQTRAGQSVGIQPLYYPLRNLTGVYDLTSLGFRIILAQQEGLSLSLTRDTAPIPGGWTNSAVHGSIIHLTPGVLADGTNNVGNWAWYDASSIKASALPLGDVLWLAADMPAVYKSDGSPWYVDLSFSFNRPATSLTWSGTYASASSPTGTEGSLVLRAMTDGTRWRVPLAWSTDSRSAYICQWYQIVFEATDPTIRTSCTPTRVLLDAFESHNVPFVSGSSRYAGATTAQDVDIFLVED